VLLQQAADRVRDLLAAAVADSDVDVQAGALRRGSPRLLEHPRRAVGEQVERADRMHPPRLAGPGELGDHLLDHLEQRLELFRGTAEIVG